MSASRTALQRLALINTLKVGLASASVVATLGGWVALSAAGNASAASTTTAASADAPSGQFTQPNAPRSQRNPFGSAPGFRSNTNNNFFNTQPRSRTRSSR